MKWREFFGKLFRPGRGGKIDKRKAMTAFTRRYMAFKSLLQANADLAAVLSQLERALNGEIAIDIREARKLPRRAAMLTLRMAECLKTMSDSPRGDLEEACRRIGARMEAELRKHTPGDLKTIALPLSDIDASMAYIVGGKSANLGELGNIMGLPIPRGFALTIKTGTVMLMRNGELFKKIYAHLGKIDSDKPHTIRACANNIMRLIMEEPVPHGVLDSALKAWDEAFGEDSHTVRVAVRSSAVAEDGMQSFAGQYDSVLGVSRDRLADAIRTVISSLFSERALTYRAAHGYALDATGMGLCCVEMVDAVAAGVAFSRHPVDLRSSCAVVHGVYGLGEQVVDGAGAPDQWLVSRATMKIRQKSIAHKTDRMELGRDGETLVRPVLENEADAPSLTDEQAAKIAGMALAIERHYHYPQDVEWAIDRKGCIILLQARPLGFDCASPDYKGDECLVGPDSPRPLLSGGDIAARGVACGPVMRIQANQEESHVAEGSILVVENSSPRLMSLLPKAGALIAENGSLTGHMASLCREFGIPAIFNLPGAASILGDGSLATVDALRGRVYEGEIPQLLELKSLRRGKPTPNTPALTLLRRAAPHILPLHLIDPKSELFTADNCMSLHDIMRFAHEQSYAEMFRFSDTLSDSGDYGMASKLTAPIPLDLYVIDLGGGLRESGKPCVGAEEVVCAPFATLLKGMLNPDVQAKGPRPVNMRGFLSVVGQSMIGANQQAGERFGDRSYALVSDRYLNFSSRVGYHYAVLDSWCGDTVNKNYIRFEFAGGAAGDVQRSRRARCIGRILGELGFSVDVAHDRIRARFQKYPRFEIASRLDQLGRLLIMTRQMDMLMVSEESVEVFATKFLNGEYH